MEMNPPIMDANFSRKRPAIRAPVSRIAIFFASTLLVQSMPLPVPGPGTSTINFTVVAEFHPRLAPTFSFRRISAVLATNLWDIPCSRVPVRSRIVFLLALMSSAVLSAQVTLPKVLTSHMVIQRDLPVHVWGAMTPSEGVSVSFRGETSSTQANPLGRWSLYLKPGAAGGPFQMTVSGIAPPGAPAEQPITLDDILVGDVWVASGQSNMEFAMRQASTAAQDLPKTANPHIRLLMIGKKAADFPQDDADHRRLGGFAEPRNCEGVLRGCLVLCARY